MKSLLGFVSLADLKGLALTVRLCLWYWFHSVPERDHQGIAFTDWISLGISKEVLIHSEWEYQPLNHTRFGHVFILPWSNWMLTLGKKILLFWHDNTWPTFHDTHMKAYEEWCALCIAIHFIALQQKEPIIYTVYQ